MPSLIAVCLALFVLTYLTVAASKLEAGSLDIVINLGIATIKATLVVMFFMHMIYDKALNNLFFIFTIGFMLLFIALAIIDTHAYNADVQSYRSDKAAAASAS